MSTLEEVKRNSEIVRSQSSTISALENAVEFLEESLADVVLKLDDVGWRPLGENVDATEIPLETVRDTAQITRGLSSINPLIKRGVAIRTSYIHGPGVSFEGIAENHALFKSKTNQKFFFSSQAKEENEACLATDGNLFLLVTKPSGRARGGTITRVPMSQIVGTVTAPDNAEDIWYYKRQWDEVSENLDTGESTKDTKTAYYPAIDFEPEAGKRPARIRNIPVIWQSAIAHNAVNRQVGWKWGLPDLTSVIFWSKAYKEFLENSAALVKAYSRFAFKVTAPSKNGVTAAAAKVAAVPSRDPHTGQLNDVGGTAVMGQGATLSTIGRTGGSVDFGAGLPLAAMVAAGLEVPLTALTSDGGSSNRSGAETLETPTLRAMLARQAIWTSFYQKIFAFLGHENVEVNWGKIDTPDTLRAVQAIGAASALNVLSAQEVRDMLLAVLEIKTEKGLPTEEELGLLVLQLTKQTEAAQAAADAKAQSADPSYGDNSNRDAQGAHNYDKSDGAGPKK